jgi:hypothetical protein
MVNVVKSCLRCKQVTVHECVQIYDVQDDATKKWHHIRKDMCLSCGLVTEEGTEIKEGSIHYNEIMEENKKRR